VDPSLVYADPSYTRSQRFALADCLYNHENESEWFGIWDVDEFVVFNGSFPDMREFVSTLFNIST
jgi:Glycosyltransferase family 92